MKDGKGYPNSKVVIMEVTGKPVGWFDCISDVARMLGTTTSTITNRIKRGAIIDGILIRYPKDKEDFILLPYLSPSKKYGNTGRAVSRKTKLPDKSIPKEKPPRPEPKKKVYKTDDVELDREQYRILAYEVKNIRVSITPCPFKGSPKPMVGSGNCVRCSSFRGRNKVTHEVACSRKYQ